MPSPSPNAAPLPALGDLAYQVQALLPTDSKMSEILLATDRQGQTVVFKIACVQQRGRAEINRRAIHNSVVWLQQMREHPGIAQLQLIYYQDQIAASRVAAPTFVAALPDWPGAPDFLITEYLAGGTLADFIGKRPLAVDLALMLTYDLAQTLAYLHAHGCVHRDLKPENILFRTPPPPNPSPGDLQPVLIDFGIAARVGEAKLISGSRLWMAPELQEAYEKEPLPVDPTWDLYALGLICCYMLSGMRPRRRQYTYQDCIDYRDSVFALLHGEAAQADADWQALISDLQQCLTCTLARDPQQRPTAAEFAATLATLLHRMGITPPSQNSVSPYVPSGVHEKPLDASSSDSRVSLLKSLQSLLLPSGAGVRHLQRAGSHAVFRTPVDGLAKIGRWVGIALVVLLGFTILASLLGDQTNDTSTAGQSTPADMAAVDLLPTTNTQALGQPTSAPSATPASVTLPPPTLAALPTTAPLAIPTLAPINLTQLTAPPTLVQFTPTPRPTATPTPTQPAPTATLLPPTSTLPPTRPAPTATVRQQPTTLPFAAIRLRQPPANTVAAQERVEFVWEAVGTTPLADHCYELVFWDPAKAHDKRSPIGAGRASRGTVNFNKLRESPDTLLRALAGSPQGFDWGVRFVAWSSPQTILQDGGEARHYTYQP